MSRLSALAATTLALILAGALPPAARAPDALATEAESDAGDTQHFAPIDAQQRARFESGAALFRQRWVVAPSAFGLWGRGPLSNAEACTDCHEANGRGRPPLAPDEPLRSMLLRLSVSGNPDPVYGDQLQHQGVLGRVPGEGEAYVSWRESAVVLEDGEVVTLRRPEFRLVDLSYGPVDAAMRLSPRLAPAVFGLGLLEAVPLSWLEQIAREQRARGVEGRINRVPDAGSGASLAGRFGLKAGQSSLRHQIAAAAHADMGLTSELFPDENCAPAQHQCRAFARAAVPELRGAQLNALELYIRLLPPPSRRNPDAAAVVEGEALFGRAGCDACHVPALRTGADGVLAQLAAQTVRAYTDLMLHDLGEALADGIPEFAAGPRDWRTPPLWGLGQSPSIEGSRFLLHDGRARSVAEAILWHGGQAHAAREAYRRMSLAERQALAAFLESL